MFLTFVQFVKKLRMPFDLCCCFRRNNKINYFDFVDAIIIYESHILRLVDDTSSFVDYKEHVDKLFENFLITQWEKISNNYDTTPQEYLDRIYDFVPMLNNNIREARIYAHLLNCIKNHKYKKISKKVKYLYIKDLTKDLVYNLKTCLRNTQATY
jgi:hypothetical protein